MKLVCAAVAVLVMTAGLSVVGFFAGPSDEALLRAFAFGLTTFVLSSITAFLIGFVLTRRNRLRAAGSVTLLLAFVGLATAIGYFAGAEDEAITRAFAIGFMTLLVSGGVSYLVYYARAMKQANITDEELDESEVVWAKTAQSMVHYKSGTPLKFWEAVGGRLFLTNQVLEFRTFPAELFSYRLVIPLEEIRRARPCRILGFISGALRVERYDGSFELFTFGAAFDVSREWADAIMDFRDDLEEETV
jgi:hypothetical protein